MKALILVAALFSPLSFAVTVIQPGQSTNVNGELVVCDGGPTQPQQAWTCACFDPHGRNYGTVTVYATGKQDAVYKSTDKCQRTFNNFDLSADPVGCYQQM